MRLSASLTANSFSVNLRPRMPRLPQLEAFQFNTALAAGNAQQTRNEMQGQTALILAALRDRTSSSSGGAAA